MELGAAVAGRTRSAPITPPCDRPFCVRVVGLLGLAPSQAPQSAHREDDGEERGHAEREECPNEEETAAAGGPEADLRPSHVDDGTPINRSDARRMMTYADRRSASTSVPYSQTTQMTTAKRFGSPLGDIPRAMSSAR